MRQSSRPVWIKTLVAIALGSTLLASCAASDESIAETEQVGEPVLDKEQTITAYARSVLEIDRLRRTAYDQIAEANSDAPPPQVICDNPDTVAGLRGEIKRIAVNYCREAKEIVEREQLNVTIFNEVTQRISDDAQLKADIENELRRLQSSGS